MFNSLSRAGLIAGVATVLLSGGCKQMASVKSGSQPDWLSGEATLYPNSHYVVANGSASSPEVAKDRALANLTKVFELHIRETSTTRQEVSSLKQDGEETVTTAQSLNRQVNIRTNKIIDGARVAEQWQHPADLTHYALAVLDRQQAGNNIRGEMNRLDQETAFELQQAENKTDALQKVAAYQRVVDLQHEREALQKMLKVIDLSGRGNSSSWNQAELRNRLEQSLNALRMQPAVLSDSVGGLDKILKGAMAHAGFVEAGGSGGYILAAGLTTQPAIFQQGWHWMRGTLTLRLTSADGRVRGNTSWPMKVSATSASQLSARMKAAVDKKLKQALKPAVLDFATANLDS